MHISPIATINTPFSEKFTIPRQAQIVHEALGEIAFIDDYRHVDSLDGLEAHSHYWVIWGFHANTTKEKTLTVRPPRLGGNQRVGVFGTRSPFRPNNLGLSVVKLVSVDRENFTMTVSGVDMLSGSPIYDIKPYIPYADSLPLAHSDWADNPPDAVFTVEILPAVLGTLHDYEQHFGVRVVSLLQSLLRYDVRPAYKKGQIDDKIYATRLYELDISWQIQGETVTVLSAVETKRE